MTLSIRGRVSSLVRWNQEQRDLIFRLVPEEGGGARGQMLIWGVAASPVTEGEVVRVTGSRKRHPVFGAGVVWDSLERVAPVSEEGQIAFLRGMIKGLTLPQAKALLARAGDLDGVIRLCRERPAELEAVLPKARVVRARLRNADWSQRERDVDVFTTLQSAGLRMTQIQDLVRQFGAAALLQMAREAPYRFAQLPQVGFASAEKVAKFYADATGQEINLLGDERLIFGLRDTVGHLTRQGDVCLSPERVLRGAARRLGLLDHPPGEVHKKLNSALAECLTRKLLVQEYGSIYTRGMARSEARVASLLLRLTNSGGRAVRQPSAVLRRSLAAERLSDEQSSAVVMMCEHPVVLLVGGPGRGKTHTLRSFIDLLDRHGKSVLLLAPTGKASKRAAQMTGRPAYTIHRACNLQGEPELHTVRRERVLQRREKLAADVVIVDESSMVDLGVMYELLRRIRVGHTTLILVGDPNQLPSVGPGRVLQDLLDADVIPTARLTQVFRQEGGSPIVDAADAINDGRMPTFEESGYRCRIFDPGEPSRHDDQEGRKLVAWVTQAIHKWSKDLDLDPLRDMQVYAPQREAAAGIRVLNEALQYSLNPNGTDGGLSARIGEGFTLRTGDKVMQSENNYHMICARTGNEVEVNNGAVGYVVEIHKKERCVDVLFEEEDSLVRYRGAKEWHQLAPAYAMSIHKSQGSETRYALLVVDSSMNPRLVSRALIYTGITRAKDGALYFGSRRGLEMAIKNTEGTARQSHLPDRLRTNLAAGAVSKPRIRVA